MRHPLLPILLLTFYTGISQTISFRIDHYSMVVEDLEKTGEFYAQVIGLQDIPHPDRAEGFRWFSIDGASQLHLIRKDTLPDRRSKSEHLCLSTSNLDAFTQKLKSAGTPFWDWEGNEGAITLRSDGVRQIYLQDPEGNWIEVNDAGS